MPEVLTLIDMHARKDEPRSRFSDAEKAEKIAELDMTDEEWRAKHYGTS